MNRILRTRTARIRILCVSAGLMLSLVVTGWCDVQGTIFKKNNQGQVSGLIKYKPSSKVYEVTDPKTGVSVTIRLAEVDRIVVKDPPELDAAIKLVQGNQAALAIPNLEKIVKDYEGMPPAARAARWLVSAYLKTGVPDKAIAIGERLVASDPRIAGDPDFAAVYWKALLDGNMLPKLKKALDDAIATGPRSLVAQALLTRGGVERKQGAGKANLESALVDGYLRVIVLFQDIKEAQPEALYNAVKCFEQLNQGAYADRMRRKLLAEFPDDPYSEQIKSGS